MTPTLRLTTLAGVCALALALAAPANAGQLAFDINGSWIGTIQCKGLFGGAKDNFTINPVMTISQNGLDLGLVLGSGASNPEQYTGLANPDAKKPDQKGEIAIVFCGTNDLVGDPPTFDELGRMTISTKPGRVKASFKGTSIFSDFSNPGPLPAGGYTCKWKYTRTDDTAPGLQTQCNAPIVTTPPSAP
jgi:hypothetical protein